MYEAVWLSSMTIMAIPSPSPDPAPSPDPDVAPPADPVVALGCLSDSIGHALRRAQAAVLQDFHRRFAAEDIRPVQFAILLVLHHNPGLRATQVAFALGLKRTNFVPLLDELEARGLAERRRVPGDRRASALFLTGEGAATLVRLERIHAGREQALAARLGPGGRATLLGLLARLTDPAFDPEPA
jgi:DNA-binding MarR family transcriptional regulator